MALVIPEHFAAYEILMMEISRRELADFFYDNGHPEYTFEYLTWLARRKKGPPYQTIKRRAIYTISDALEWALRAMPPDPEKFVRRQPLVDVLKEHGFKVSYNTLGQWAYCEYGPPIKMYHEIPYYNVDDALEWFRLHKKRKEMILPAGNEMPLRANDAPTT